jgi:hypothetical protein
MKLLDTTDVLIGGYLSRDAAEEDYNAVLDSGASLHGAAVVAKDLEGNVSVEQPDHMVRAGAEGVGAVGLAVGLLPPPVLPPRAACVELRRRACGNCRSRACDLSDARGRRERDDAHGRRTFSTGGFRMSTISAGLSATCTRVPSNGRPRVAS